MKKLNLLFAALLFAAIGFAQAPQKMSYQSVIRDAAGELITDSPVGIQITIEQFTTFTSVYGEQHTVTTNANGLATLQIGTGTVFEGVFANIDWGDGPYNLIVEIDPDGGNSYTIGGDSELLSVPYALYSGNSGDNHWVADGDNISNENVGFVGVGTDSPSSQLEVQGTTRTTALFVGDGTVDDASGGRSFVVRRNPLTDLYISLQDDDSGVNEWEFAGNSDADLILSAGFDQHVFFKPNGFVGLGTSSPTEKLTVDGNIKILGGGASGFGVFHDGSPNNHLRFLSNNHTFLSGASFVSLQSGGSDRVFVHPNFLAFSPTGTENMRLTDAGLGLGTDTPAATLHVNGGAIIGSTTQPQSIPLRVIAAPNNLALRLDRNDGAAGWELFSGTDGLNFCQSGVACDRLFLSNTGNVGIGTNIATEKLTVNGRIQLSNVPIDNSLNQVVVLDANGALSQRDASTLGGAVSQWAVNGSSMYNNNAGFVGIGTSSPATPLHVANSTGGEIARIGSNADAGWLSLVKNGVRQGFLAYGTQGIILRSDTDSGYLKFQTQGADRMAIGPGGNVGIGTLTPVSKLQVVHADGQLGIGIRNAASPNYWSMYEASASSALQLYLNGGIRGAFNSTSGNYTSVSDIKFKKNITTLEKGTLEKLMTIRATKYNFKTQEEGDSRLYYGVIAQELEEVYPELVEYDERTDSRLVSYTELIPILIASIQDQQALILELQANNDQKEADMDEIKKQLVENAKLMNDLQQVIATLK